MLPVGKFNEIRSWQKQVARIINIVSFKWEQMEETLAF